MNLALFSHESAGNKDLMRSVRRTINIELQKFVSFDLKTRRKKSIGIKISIRLLEAKRTPTRNNYFGTFQWNRVNNKTNESKSLR